MNNYQQDIYALQDWKGDLIGLDKDSGGYPYVPTSLSEVWFASYDSVKRYSDVVPGRFNIVRVQVSLEEVK